MISAKVSSFRIGANCYGFPSFCTCTICYPLRRIRISSISLVRRYRSFAYRSCVCSIITSYYIGRNLISGFFTIRYFIHLDSCPCVNVNGIQCFFELCHIDSICIFGTSCHIRNLTSYRRSTYRYSTCCGNPSGSRSN